MTEGNQIVFSDIDEFVWGLQFDEEAPNNSDQKGDGRLESESKENEKDGIPRAKEEEIEVPEDTRSCIREAGLGKGISGALKHSKERGLLDKESFEDDEGRKEIRIDRMDEYGRPLNGKEDFRVRSYIFHGQGPGKRKQEKRRQRNQMELKQMKNENPSCFAENTRELMLRSNTPFLVLNDLVKPMQTSGFATIDKVFKPTGKKLKIWCSNQNRRG